MQITDPRPNRWRILRKYGYAQDKQDKVTQFVLEHPEVLCGAWAGSPA